MKYRIRHFTIAITLSTVATLQHVASAPSVLVFRSRLKIYRVYVASDAAFHDCTYPLRAVSTYATLRELYRNVSVSICFNY